MISRHHLRTKRTFEGDSAQPNLEIQNADIGKREPDNPQFERARRMTILANLLEDRDFEPRPGLRAHILRILDAIRANLDASVGNTAPVQSVAVGNIGLDGQPWSMLASEIEDFMDFQRYRREEAAWRGQDESEIHPSIQEWLGARRAKYELELHQRKVRETPYVDENALARFRIV